MAGVKFDAAKFTKAVAKQAAKRVLIDFSSEGSKRRVLGREFDQALEQRAKDMALVVAPVVEHNVKQHYRESLDLVAGILKNGLLNQASIQLGEGVSQTVNFTLLTSKYRAQKLRYHPETSDLFWKYSGALSKSFRAFAGARKSAVTRSKATTTLKSRSYQYRHTRYRFQIDVVLPEIKGSRFLDNVFRRAYLLGATTGSAGAFNKLGFDMITAAKRSDPLSYLAFNETQGPIRKDGQSKTRPFLTELMSKRGTQVNSLIHRRLTAIL